MMAKLRIAGPLAMSMIGTICAVSGCRSHGLAYNEAVYKGRSSTSRDNVAPERIFDETQRSFPANKDEVQFCMFGTNGWMRVESYPDGMPCRITRGVTTEGGERGNPLTEMEFDVYGNVISMFTVWGNGKVPGHVSVPSIKPSPYWQQGLRVLKIISELTVDYYIGVYYYQTSDNNLEVCAWAIDRKNKQMDKLVFTLELKDGHPVFSPNIKSHDGSLTELAEVLDLGGDCIGVEFKLHVNGRYIPVKGCIAPGGLTLAF